MSLLQQAKAELLRSNADKKHPFRYCSLSTLAEYPETRMVVTRKVSQNLELTFFTDSRTPKVKQIQANNKVTALFYHPRKRLQIRVKGIATIIGEGHTDYPNYLHQVQQSPSLRDYTTLQIPGSPLTTESVVHGTDIHFLTILVESLFLDILLLSREGHRRSAYYYMENGQWKEEHLVP
jgi:hypothetical protein